MHQLARMPRQLVHVLTFTSLLDLSADAPGMFHACGSYIYMETSGPAAMLV